MAGVGPVIVGKTFLKLLFLLLRSLLLFFHFFNFFCFCFCFIFSSFFFFLILSMSNRNLFSKTPSAGHLPSPTSSTSSLFNSFNQQQRPSSSSSSSSASTSSFRPSKLTRQGTVVLQKNPSWPTDSHQESENDIAQFILLCKPGLPKFMVSPLSNVILIMIVIISFHFVRLNSFSREPCIQLARCMNVL